MHPSPLCAGPARENAARQGHDPRAPPGKHPPVKAISTIIYKPIGIIAGVIAGLLSARLFTWVWGKFDDEEPPKPNTEWADWPKLLSAAAIQGVIFRVVRTVVDRGTAKGFHYLTGIWPGERTPDRA